VRRYRAGVSDDPRTIESTRKEVTTMQRIKKRILDTLAPLASLIVGLAFLRGWRRRRQQVQRELAEYEDEDEDFSS
jgi:hypothetical protein